MSDIQQNYAAPDENLQAAESYLKDYEDTKNLRALQDSICCLYVAINEGYPKNQYIMNMCDEISNYLKQEFSKNGLYTELIYHFQYPQRELNNDNVDKFNELLEEYYYYIYMTTLYKLEQKLFSQQPQNTQQQQNTQQPPKPRIRTNSSPAVLTH